MRWQSLVNSHRQRQWFNGAINVRYEYDHEYDHEYEYDHELI